MGIIICLGEGQLILPTRNSAPSDSLFCACPADLDLVPVRDEEESSPLQIPLQAGHYFGTVHLFYFIILCTC